MAPPAYAPHALVENRYRVILGLGLDILGQRRSSRRRSAQEIGQRTDRLRDGSTRELLGTVDADRNSATRAVRMFAFTAMSSAVLALRC